MKEPRCSLCGHRETTAQRRARLGLCTRCGEKTDYRILGVNRDGQEYGYQRSLCPKHLEELRQKARARKAKAQK